MRRLSNVNIGRGCRRQWTLANKVAVFACQVEGVQRRYAYEGIEDVVFLSAEELRKWIAEGKITDGFTLSAYSLYCAKNPNV